jgi:PAS domain S-box-containing protein
MKRKPKINLETKQKSLLEVEELRTGRDATERRLQEASSILPAQIAERKRAEESFEKAQEYAKSIVETIREPLLVLAPDLKVISANQSFYQTFQVTPKETEGRFVYSMGKHQWDIPALRKLLEEIVPQNTHFNDFEVDHKFPAVGRRRMFLNARRIYRQGRGTDMILLAIEDVTERKQMEEALEVSEVRFRRLFETAQDGILILDADTGQISNVNQFLIEMLGYSQDHFLGKKLWEIGAFKDIHASRTAFSKLQTKGYVRYEDLPLQTKDGRLIDVEFVSNVYRVDHHKVIQCNIRDITERKKIEEALKISETRYRRLFETAQDGILILDAETGQISDVNPFLVEMLGYSHEEFLGKKLWEIGAFKNIEASKAIFSKLQEKGYVRYEDLLLETKDGRSMAVEFVSNVYLVNHHKVIQCNIRDITERKKAEEKIEHLASFPDLNPNPVIETDLKEQVIFYNAATMKILKELNVPEEVRLFLPRDLNEMIKKLEQGKDRQYFAREVEINDRVFIESLFLSAKMKVVRIYAQEITKRKRAEVALQKAYGELDLKVKERTEELSTANKQLTQEIDERKKAEKSLWTALSEIKTMKDQLEAENIYFRQENKMKHRFENILGQSDGLKYVLYRAEQVAPANTTVLILGETGTGKELIAAAIHNMSPRKDQPLITVNCAALPANLIESELFGREKGAFTGADTRRVGRFEVAHGSTLCLDEIGELPLEVQAKLLRVIQHNEFERLGSSQTVKVDIRLVATTNRNLEEEVRKGRFRQDLYYRLNVFPITVPPLRQRKDDIPVLVEHFIDKFNKKTGKRIETVSKDTLNTLREYDWPGNVRELESIIERAVILCPGPVLQLADKLETSPPLISSALRTLEETERSQILKILSETKWRIEGKDGAAAILGIHPSTLRARMRKDGIRRP